MENRESNIILTDEARRGIEDAKISLHGALFFVLLNRDGTLSRGMPEDPCDWHTPNWNSAQKCCLKRDCVILHMGTLVGRVLRSKQAVYVRVFNPDGTPVKPIKVKKVTI